MSAEIIGFSLLLIGITLFISKLIRIKFKIFSKFFLPSSIIAGFLLLLLGPQVLGVLLSNIEGFEHGLLSGEIIEVFSSLPGLLISVIFASLFLGKKIPNIKKIWNTAGPQVSFGQSVAWGQYVVGILITLIVLTPFFGINPMAGALIEIAFEGGHGTSAGLADTFSDLGFEEGADLAMGLATVGVLSGIIFGVILINWAVKNDKSNYLKDPKTIDENELRGIVDPENRKSGSKLTTSTQSIEPLALHVGAIGFAILLGYGILQALLFIEGLTWGNTFKIFEYVPLFPLAMIGGLIVQIFLDKYDKFKLIDRDMIKRIQGLTLDFLIVSAIATLSLAVIGNNIGPFLILALVGISWNITAFLILAPRMIPKNWFERGIGDFGQSMGMTAIGIMLIRISDPGQKTKALEAFGYKQLLFEPIVGGGLMTAVSIPLIFQFGPVPILIFSFVVMIIWILIGILHFGKK